MKNWELKMRSTASACLARHGHVRCSSETFSNRKCYVGRHSTHRHMEHYLCLWIVVNLNDCGQKANTWISAMYERNHPLDFCNRSLLHQVYSFLLPNWRGFENLMRFSISTIRMVDLKGNGKMCQSFWLTVRYIVSGKSHFFRSDHASTKSKKRITVEN